MDGRWQGKAYEIFQRTIGEARGEAQEEDDRWSKLDYLLHHGKFEVAYFYPDAIDPQEELIERRERALQRHFGDKPIVYPPPLRNDGIPSYCL